MRKIQVLLLEDSEDDALLVLNELENSGFEPNYERVYSKQAMIEALQRRDDWDLVLSDHGMPGFSSVEALLVLLERELEIPLIIVSGTIGEELAVEAMKAGAHDFVMKDHLSRLGPAVNNALLGSQSRREAREYQQRLRELSTHLELVREAERASIAREIHDELGGVLTALKMDVRWLHKQCAASGGDAASEKFSAMSSHLDSAINTVRRIITDLRPSVLDDLGLVAALEWQLSEFEKRYAIACNFSSDVQKINFLATEHEVAVFRIFQESLTNIAKHAQASEVNVELKCEDNTLLLDILDNGKGISDNDKFKKGHYGILGMNERALSINGELFVQGQEEVGTRVRLLLPLQQEGV